MRRILIALSLTALLMAALAMPGGASASHLSRADFKSTSKYCKALRAEMGAKAFKRAFRAKRIRGAHRRCVKRKGAVRESGVRAQAPVSIFPVPANACPPGTVPEPPLPVRAFADACVPQAAPVVACDQDDGDEDEPESEDAACEDSADDDDDGDEGGDDSDDDDRRHSDVDDDDERPDDD